MKGVGSLPSLKIGDLEINPPIIQGGMGVRVSASRLASAVSNEGCLGTVATVGTGEEWPDRTLDYTTRSYLGLRSELQKTKSLTSRPFAVNIMCVLNNYDSLVTATVEEDVAAIISGAGLPLRLPSLVGNSRTKLIPIVSSGRAADLIARTWSRRYSRVPDAFVVEGPLAGGHLGFKLEDTAHSGTHVLDAIVKEVLQVAEEIGKTVGRKIPVVAAGGVYDGKDIAHFLELGAGGVQMATRFVCTHECDAAIEYKQAYVNARKEDIMLIKSPVGLPLRVIRNPFVDRITHGERVAFRCQYQCLATCDPKTTRYCIAQALVNSYRGNMDLGFTTCGANAYRIDKIVSVHELVQELVQDAAKVLSAGK
ncbi:MAG: nitronate monooxygenase family protein [bacterium]